MFSAVILCVQVRVKCNCHIFVTFVFFSVRWVKPQAGEQWCRHILQINKNLTSTKFTFYQSHNTTIQSNCSYQKQIFQNNIKHDCISIFRPVTLCKYHKFDWHISATYSSLNTVLWLLVEFIHSTSQQHFLMVVWSCCPCWNVFIFTQSKSSTASLSTAALASWSLGTLQQHFIVPAE